MTKKKKAKTPVNATIISPTKFKLVTNDDRSTNIMSKIEELSSILMLDNHVDIFIPNQIFDDLKVDIIQNGVKSDLSWKHQAFCYSYYYLISYLYRNCIQAKIDDLSKVNLTSIKCDLLGIRGDTLNFLIKKNGLLDQLGYTFTTNDIPVYAEFDRDSKEFKGFELMSDVKARSNDDFEQLIKKIPSKFQLKLPLKGLYAFLPKSYSVMLNSDDSEDKEMLDYYDGHYFDVYATHKMQIETFIACMANPILGYRGFYLYGFYRMQNDRFTKGLDMTLEQIQKVLNIHTDTLKVYNAELIRMNLISCKTTPYKPNVYRATSHVPVIII